MMDALKNTFKSEMFITIISGVVVFIISQIIMEKIIKPRDKFKEEKGKIVCYITMYANLIFNPCKMEDYKKDNNYYQASQDIRMVASEFAGLLESHPIVCRKKKYKDIVRSLIGISNGFHKVDNEDRTIDDNRELVNSIYKKFGIKERH